MKHIADFVCNHKKLVLILSCLLFMLSIVGIKMTRVNYDILVYLPEDIETIKGQNILTNDFNMGSYSIAVVNNLDSKDILKLEDEIKKVEGVNKVGSIYDIIGTTIPIEMLPNDIVEKVHNENSDLLIITFSDSTSSEKTLNAVSQIREISNNIVKQGGMSSMVLDTMNLSNKEVAVYVVIAVILCILVLEISLDSYAVPIILLANIGFAIIFNLGSNVFLGQISYITKALVAILQLGVTTDFSIFLYHAYESKKEKLENKNDAMKEAICETFTSVTGSSLTTIAGFLVLCAMQLSLGKDLGIVMAKGVLLGVICVLTLFPSFLLIFDNIIEKTKHKKISFNFTKLNQFIIKHKIAIFVIFIILLVPTYLAYSKVDVYYKLDRSLPSTLESIKTNQILKDNYNIVSPEIVLIDKNIKNDDVSSMIRQIEKTSGIEWVLSLSKLNEMGITSNMLNGDILNLIQSKDYQLILLNSSYETATDELNNQIETINNIVKGYDKNGIVAGEGPLMKDLVNICDIDFKNVNSASIICIFIILFFVLKSLSLPFLLIIAIEFAIFMNMSFSYFSGTTLPFIAPIVLGTIQLGATIDYAILLTTTYLKKRNTNIEKNKAMLETLNYCGVSIFISGMCFFAATFGVGIYSKIEMIGSLCSLIARGAIISMLVVIAVLPTILLLFDKLIIKTTLKERKDKNMKENFKKVTKKVAVSTLALLLLLNPLSAFALIKNETVYTKLNQDGSVKNVLVNEQLINSSKLDELEDYTELENILNINNDNTFRQDGSKITWNALGKDIFYQGTTDKKLPVSLNITYKLNDMEMNPKEMLGKNGKVTITLKYTNTDSHAVYINGNYETLYTPFVIALGTVLDSEENTNITVTNGKVVSNGTKSIIAAISTPGLYESLKLDELKNMDTVIINYETTKFELSSIYSVVTPKLVENSDLEIFTKMDSIYGQVNSLQDNMNKIDSAAKQVSDGSSKLKDGLSSSINSLKEDDSNALTVEQINAIKDEAVIAIKQTFTPEYKNAIAEKTWNEVKESLSSSNNAEIEGYVKESVINIMKTYLGGDENFAYYGGCLEKNEAACSALAVNFDFNTVQAFQKSITEQITNTVLKTTNSVAEKVSKQVAMTLSEEVAEQTAYSVSESLALEVANLVKKSAIGTITDSLNSLYSGISQLDDGINQLSAGISTFNKNGINKVSNMVNSKVKAITNRMQALTELSENYKSFTTNNSNLENGETKFVLVIDSMKAPKEIVSIEKEKDSLSFWDRVKNLFS